MAVFTNLTRDHLDYHGSMEAYGAAKAKLFQRPGLKAAAINLDDAFGRELIATLASDVQAIGLSSTGQSGATIRAENLVLDGQGIGFDLIIGDARHPLRSPLLGRFNVDNLLAVAGALYGLGQPTSTIAHVLGQLQPIAGRMNRLGGHGEPTVVIDYAHTPDALEQALRSLHGHLNGRLLCVFGCGGERDTGKRPQMAAIAEELADVVFVTDDNPRGEDGDVIVADIMAGFADASRVNVQRDRARAIGAAVAQAGPGDIVLVAGKGHEPYQEIAGIKHPFDDTDVASRALLARAAVGQEVRS
ncbi:UDP-N-acetylmuramoyl-L-alanyl-D-glutamate--2,6-diaminopimelate ligase [compost metagenome]